ncbi:MAG: hypothetical protein KF841_01565 [Phycisphaerae bacterium]|nr:hypothetical protein [Phycisphaerae bacterium]
MSPDSTENRETIPVPTPDQDAAPSPISFWRRIATLAALLVLGITPFAQAQLDPPNYPSVCPPLTSLANPTLFDLLWGTTPIRFPYQ